MINPQPVDTPQSPYSSRGETPRPVMFAQPQIPSVGTPVNPVPQKPKKKLRWKRAFGVGFLALIMGGFFYGYSQYNALTANIITDHEGASSEILGYNPDSKKGIDASKFVNPGDGRFNMVIVGMGGENHPGGNLTDSIQVLSIDTINKTNTFTSIPRDLYVNVTGMGRTKINAVYTYGEQKKKGSGALALKEAVGTVLGTKVSNYAVIDFTGIQQIVDALGGIEVNVPKALNDPLYPAEDMVHYSPFSVAAGKQKMDGKTALKYSRSRETTSDFDRSARQQLVIAAIKEKALSLGVLANPVKTANLRDALGTHFKTDLQTDDIRKLLDIYKQIPSDKSGGFVLDTSASLGLLTSATVSPGPGYISYPLLGYDRYEGVHQWHRKNNPDPLITKEGPSVTLYNSGKASQKQLDAYAQLLKDYGYTVTIGTTNEKVSKMKVVAKNPDSKPVSRNYLASITKTSVEKGKVSSSPASDFEIIYVPSSTAASVPKATSTPKPSAKATATPTATPTTTPAPSLDL
ncbi:MAG TPA: LCP family protein [Verrucomicrobiae bacterium]|nr:LCP family protein [Verrucomicrobiae bacterium]